MNEYDMIEQLVAHCPRSAQQQNGLFEADAELVRMADGLWAFTTDEFSAEEDGFTTDNPAALGSNLAVATLHDLFAVGATPAFFLSALVLPQELPTGFAAGVARGMADVLATCGCHLLGGDLGQSSSWRFTGTAFGPVVGPACTRELTAADCELWISGPLGDANAALLSGAPTPRFELRLELAQALRGHATACIDTSGGLLDALQMLVRVNPGIRFVLDVAAVPIAPLVRSAADQAGFPAHTALVAGAGEYELLFAVRAADSAVRQDLLRLGAMRIGAAQASDSPGLYLGGRGTPAPACPDARLFTTRDAYLAAVVEAGKRLEEAS